jgi:hypothetical protein
MLSNFPGCFTVVGVNDAIKKGTVVALNRVSSDLADLTVPKASGCEQAGILTTAFLKMGSARGWLNSPMATRTRVPYAWVSARQVPRSGHHDLACVWGDAHGHAYASEGHTAVDGQGLPARRSRAIARGA